MNIKTLGLVCAITSSTLIGCRRPQQITPKIKLTNYMENNVSKAMKNDTTYFFLHKKIYHKRNFKGKEFIDTIAGYLKAANNDLIIFIQNGKNLPKDVKQVGKKLSNETFNYY